MNLETKHVNSHIEHIDLTSMIARLFLCICLILFAAAAHAQFQRLLGPTASTWVLFGESISMHGNYAIVGEPAYDANGLIYEKVHIYKLNYQGWSRIQTFRSSSITGENDLGGRTGMSENWLAFSQISGASSFKYFLYQKQADTFAFRQTIAHPDPWNHQFVCKTIALTDEHLIVGGAGSAYCYQIDPNFRTLGAQTDHYQTRQYRVWELCCGLAK